MHVGASEEQIGGMGGGGGSVRIECDNLIVNMLGIRQMCHQMEQDHELS